MRSLLLVMLAACTDHGQSPGMSDASRDGMSPMDVADPCPGGMHLTGELIDWDSPIGGFMGVFDAKLFTPGNPTPILSTPPNGRMDTCVPTANPLRLDVDAPTDYLDGTMVIQPEALASLRPLSFRSIKMARASSFFAERGLTFDPNRAQVVVFLAGDRAQIALDRPHGTAQAGNDDGSPGNFVWSVGDTGRYVLFPNVDTAQATGMISGPLPAMAVPLAPGKLTLVAVSFVFI
jgi:hypothetical protein